MTEFEKKLLEALVRNTEALARLEFKIELALKIGIADLKVDLQDAKRDTAVRSLNLTAGTPVPIKPPTQRIVVPPIDDSFFGFAKLPAETEDMKCVRRLVYEPRVHEWILTQAGHVEMPEQVQHRRSLCEIYIISHCRVKSFSECVSGEAAERLHTLVVTLGGLL